MNRIILVLLAVLVGFPAWAQPAAPACQFPGDNACVRSVANTIVTAVPTTGQTIVVPPNTQLYIVSPAGTLAALTITMPLYGYNIGDQLTITLNQIITSLAVNANTGQTIQGAAVSAATTALGASFSYRWILPGTWQRVQ